MIGSMTWKKFPLTRLALLTIPIAILAVVSGCGGAKSIQQSVIVKDTVVVTQERILHDTLMIQRDTVIYQDRVKVEVKYLEGERVYVSAECPSDTVRIETVRIHNTIAPEPKKKKWSWEGLLGWSIAILCILVILKQFAEQLIKKLF
jgi:hypothetical protein